MIRRLGSASSATSCEPAPSAPCRAIRNNSNDQMLPAEIDIVARYITAVNP